MTSMIINLKKAIPNQFRLLNPLEAKILKASTEGLMVSGEPGKKSKPDANIVRGEFLSWILGDKAANIYIHRTGFFLEGAHIEGVTPVAGFQRCFSVAENIVDHRKTGHETV